jgi:hypothetical protein
VEADVRCGRSGHYGIDVEFERLPGAFYRSKLADALVRDQADEEVAPHVVLSGGNVPDSGEQGEQGTVSPPKSLRLVGDLTVHRCPGDRERLRSGCLIHLDRRVGAWALEDNHIVRRDHVSRIESWLGHHDTPVKAKAGWSR